METDITNMVLGVVIGVGVSMSIIALYIWHVMNKFEAGLREHVRMAVREVEAALLPVIVEQDGDQIFVYSEKDRQFLVQGTTAQEIRERFDQRFPDRIAYMAGGDADLIARLKAELAELKAQEKNENSISV